MRNAYRLNPKEKYVNYYIGKNFLNDNQVDSAERYLLAELKTSEYYDSYFLLSRVYFLKKDMSQSISYLEQYMEKDPRLPQAINNYLLMLADTGQFEKARQFIAKKQAAGISVNSELIDMIKTKSALAQP
jgi:tetratricopeptide (TPR) repeat protein